MTRTTDLGLMELPGICAPWCDMREHKAYAWEIEVHALQRRQPPYDGQSGWAGPALVALHIGDTFVADGTSIEMTTGEARCLAAFLLRMCEEVDFGHYEDE